MTAIRKSQFLPAAALAILGPPALTSKSTKVRIVRIG